MPLVFWHFEIAILLGKFSQVADKSQKQSHLWWTKVKNCRLRHTKVQKHSVQFFTIYTLGIQCFKVSVELPALAFKSSAKRASRASFTHLARLGRQIRSVQLALLAKFVVWDRSLKTRSAVNYSLVTCGFEPLTRNFEKIRNSEFMWYDFNFFWHKKHVVLLLIFFSKSKLKSWVGPHHFFQIKRKS